MNSAKYQDTKLIFRNHLHFYILLLICWIHLSVLVVSWWNLWGSLYTVSCHLQIQFYYFFWIWMPFIPPSCLIDVAKTSSTMLNKRGESGHHCLCSDLKGNSCSFCPLSMMLAVGLSYMAFIMFRDDLSNPTLLRVFIINGCWVLSNAFSATVDIIMRFLSFILLVVNHIFWFMYFFFTSLAFLE